MVAVPGATPVAPAAWVTPLIFGTAWHAVARPPRRIAKLLLAPPIGIVRAVDRDSFPGDDDAAHAARIQVGVPPVDDRRSKPVGDPHAFLQLARQPWAVAVFELVEGPHEDASLCNVVVCDACQEGAVQLVHQSGRAQLI